MANNFNKWILLLAGWLVWTTGCIREDNGPDNQVPGGSAEVTLSLKLPGTAVPSTRALGKTHENEVGTIDVFVFDTGGNLVDIGYGRNITDASDSDNVMRNFSVTLRTGTGRDIMIIANAREIIQNLYGGAVPLDGSVTKTGFRERLTVSVPAADGWNANPGSSGYRDIPMWGERKGIDIDKNTSLTGTANSIKISRMLARVNVSLDDLITPSDFRLTTVRLYNYNTVGKLIPNENAGNWDALKPYAASPSLPGDPKHETGPLEYLTMTTTDRALMGAIYVFEGEKGVSTRDDSPGADFMKNPCLVIGGHFGGSADETFYRIDFVENNGGTLNYLHILRNHSYNVKVKKIGGPGKPTEEEAFNSLPVNIDTEVIAWDEHDMNEADTDGQYQLTVDRSRLTFWDEGREQTMKIFTDYPHGWKVESSTLPAGLVNKVSPMAGTAGNAVEVKIEPGSILSIDPTVAAGDTIRYSFWITAGSMRKQIHIEHINEPEYFIEVSTSVLSFRRGAPNAKTVTITVYPENTPVWFEESGNANINWVAGKGPSDYAGMPNPGEFTYELHPTVNTSDPAATLSSLITVYITDGDGVTKDSKTINVSQLSTDVPFVYSMQEYPAEGGTMASESIFFNVSRAGSDWKIGGVLNDTDNIIEEYDAGVQPATDTGYNYYFGLRPNPTFQKRTATFKVIADSDPEFAERELEIVQNFKTPYLNIAPSSKNVHLGSDQNGASETVTVNSNTRWRYSFSQSSEMSGIFGVGFPENTETGSLSALTDHEQQITIDPVQMNAGTGLPAAGKIYYAYIDLESVNTPTPITDRVTVTRTVPSYFQVTGFSSVSGSTLTAAEQYVTVYANTNNAWSISNNLGYNDSEGSNPWHNTSLSVYVPANADWNSRSIVVYYSGTDVNGPTDANISYTQTNAYWLDGVNSISHNPIPGGKTDVTVTVGGNYPGGWVQVLATGVGTEPSATITSGNSAVLSIPHNPPVNGDRYVYFYYQYYIPSSGTWSGWIHFSTVSQQIGNPVVGNIMVSSVSQGRCVKGDAISVCATYSEPGYPTGWRLPTVSEMVQMLSIYSDLGWGSPAHSIINSNYWCTQDGNPNNVGSPYNGTFATGQSPTTQRSVRCVRTIN